MQDYIIQTREVLLKKPPFYKNIDDFRKVVNKASDYLCKKDKILAEIIPKIGICRLKPHRKYFETLVDAIISQQLSVLVAEAIFKRFKILFNKSGSDRTKFPLPADILSMSDFEIKACGLSNAKVSYVKDLASHVLDNRLKIRKLNKLDDNEIINELVRVKGIGVWTAKMFLIFCLGRLNVLPFEDLGLKKAIRINYNLRKIPDIYRIERISKINGWAPFNSVATWYLWQSLSIK